jgi:hypothetical protein
LGHFPRARIKSGWESESSVESNECRVTSVHTGGPERDGGEIVEFSKIAGWGSGCDRIVGPGLDAAGDAGSVPSIDNLLHAFCWLVGF